MPEVTTYLDLFIKSNIKITNFAVVSVFNSLSEI
jgi:hypothetical protein